MQVRRHVRRVFRSSCLPITVKLTARVFGRFGSVESPATTPIATSAFPPKWQVKYEHAESFDQQKSRLFIMESDTSRFRRQSNSGSLRQTLGIAADAPVIGHGRSPGRNQMSRRVDPGVLARHENVPACPSDLCWRWDLPFRVCDSWLHILDWPRKFISSDTARIVNVT